MDLVLVAASFSAVFTIYLTPRLYGVLAAAMRATAGD